MANPLFHSRNIVISIVPELCRIGVMTQQSKMPEAMKSCLFANISYRMRSRLNAISSGNAAAFILVLMVLGSFSIAQDNSAQQPNGFAITGTVVDSTGKDISDAQVRLEQNGTPTIVMTNARGAFLFSNVPPGSYVISAEKSGLRSRTIAVPAPTDGHESHIDLVLEPSSPASQSPAETMSFADKPNFTVAGITDWTAVGGHGSDTSLRTSEALARETATLKPDSNGAGSSGAAPTTSETETRLRAALARDPQSFEANHQLGEFCFHKGSYREAIPALEAAYRIDPSNQANEYELALAYKGAGDFAQAHEHIQKLLKQEDNADLHRVLGDLDEESRDSLAAVHEYEQAVRLDPSEQNYFAWGSELLLHRAVWPAAEVFRKGSEAHPKSARMLAALGAALFASANYSDAAARLCEASDLNPADPAPYIFLGKIDLAAPDPLPCVESRLLRYNQLQPKDVRAKYYYAMAIWKRLKASDNSPKLQQVESLLTEAVALDAKYAEAYLQLGNIYSDERDFQKAISFYLKAIDANPQLSDAHYRLGVAYQRTGDSAKAMQELDLHDEIEKAQAAEVERQRQEVKQFLVVLQSQPAVH